MSETLVVVDDRDNFIRYAPREECHSGNGIHHRAFTILILNKNKEILLQKRKHEIWDGYWDLTNSHPLHLGDRNESYEEAAVRCLKQEWDISIEPSAIKNLFGFNYFDRYDGRCENEYCMLVVAEYSGEVKPNKEVCYEFKWVKYDELLEDVMKNQTNYTPWLVMAIKELQNHSFSRELETS